MLLFKQISVKNKILFLRFISKIVSKDTIIQINDD